VHFQFGLAPVGEVVEELAGRRLERLLLQRDRRVPEPWCELKGKYADLVDNTTQVDTPTCPSSASQSSSFPNVSSNNSFRPAQDIDVPISPVDGPISPANDFLR